MGRAAQCFRMALFADGGYLASKPYSASGTYINKMSNYCNKCSFQVKKKMEPKHVVNYLYWDFLARNREKLSSNHRLWDDLQNTDRMSDRTYLIKRMSDELS